MTTQRKKEISRKSYLKNRARYLLKAKQMRALNPDYYKKYASEYRAKNREKCKLAVKIWTAKNKEKWAAYQKQWALNNPEKCRLKAKRYKDKNPHYAFKHNHLRRIRTSISIEDQKAIDKFIRKSRKNPKNVCFYCGTGIEKIHFDHEIPLCMGGKHHVSNLRISCHKCNLSKGGKLLSEWRQSICV
jgi:5-methylcytosine-specific restriction endonuclease McrA